MANSNQLHPLNALPSTLEFKPYTKAQVRAAQEAPRELAEYVHYGRPLDALPPGTPKKARLYHFEQAAYTLHRQPLDVQRRYADARVRAKCADEQYHTQELLPRFAAQSWYVKDVLSVHLTYVGGLAYCACYAPTQQLRRDYAQILREFVAWRESYSQMDAWVAQDTHFYPDGTTTTGDVFGFAALALATVMMAAAVFFFYFCTGYWLWAGFALILLPLIILSPLNRLAARAWIQRRARSMLENANKEE